jgi:hypothetical protein
VLPFFFSGGSLGSIRGSRLEALRLSESRKRAEKAYLELTRIGVWSLGESSICISPFGCTALEHPLKGPYDLVLAPCPIGPAPDVHYHYMRKYVWPVPSDSDSESTNLPGVEHPLYHVPGGLLIPVRRRVVHTQVPRSSDSSSDSTKRKRARPRRFNPETGGEYSPLR